MVLILNLKINSLKNKFLQSFDSQLSNALHFAWKSICKRNLLPVLHQSGTMNWSRTVQCSRRTRSMREELVDREMSVWQCCVLRCCVAIARRTGNNVVSTTTVGWLGLVLQWEPTGRIYGLLFPASPGIYTATAAFCILYVSFIYT